MTLKPKKQIQSARTIRFLGSDIPGLFRQLFVVFGEVDGCPTMGTADALVFDFIIVDDERFTALEALDSDQDFHDLLSFLVFGSGRVVVAV